MVRLHIAITPARGKSAAAREWAVNVTRLVNDLSPSPAQFMTVAYGVAGLHWFHDFDDVPALDANRKMLAANAEYSRMLTDAQNDGLFEPGSLSNTVYETA